MTEQREKVKTRAVKRSHLDVRTSNLPSLGSSGHISPTEPGAMTEVHRLAKAPGTLLASTTSRMAEPIAPAKCSTAWIPDGSASWYCLRACSTVSHGHALALAATVRWPLQ
jgi:hypothetical protein